MYLAHFRESVLPGLHAVPGFLSANVLTQDSDGSVEILVLTYWESFDAIDAFASPDREAAVVADAAAALLGTYDRRVRHYHVAIGDGRKDL